MIYLDYAATTPISEKALQAYAEASKHFYGNSSSLHDIGSDAADLLELCREKLSGWLNCDRKGIYFTSGGTESNILAITSLIDARKHLGNHLITTECEHSSVYNLFKKLEKSGFKVTYVPVKKDGMIDLHALKNAVKDTTILASIQHVNSETGVIQPIRKIARILHKNNVLYHCDMVQSFGKIPVNIEELQIDSVSVSGHKVYGPKGVGAVYINPKIKWQPQLPGTTHEQGFRPGTVNVPGICSFTVAADEALEHMETEQQRIKALREELVSRLKKNPRITIEECKESQLPNILGLRIEGMEGQYAMLECNRSGLAISTGSACAIGMQEPSRTIMAMGRTKEGFFTK